MTFTAYYGDETKECVISSPTGSGGSMLHFYIDNFYQGIFLKRDTWEWKPQDPEKCEFTSDDRQILLELVKANF